MLILPPSLLAGVDAAASHHTVRVDDEGLCGNAMVFVQLLVPRQGR